MTSITGNVQISTGTPKQGVLVSFRPLGTTRVRVGSLIPPFEITTTSDSNGDFSVSLLDGEYEVTFDGRGRITVIVPDDTENSYNVATLLSDSPGIIEVIARTMPVRGINYLFSSDGYFYLFNITTRLWHPISLDGDPGTLLIDASANPALATAIPTYGTNFVFQADKTFRLKNTTTGLFQSMYSIGPYGGETTYFPDSGAAISAASVIFVQGTNMRVVGQLMQFFNSDQGKWATPYIAGPEDAESIVWYPAVT